MEHQLILMLGNHDTNLFLADGHYRNSAFQATHGAAEPTRVLPIPTDHRWIVLFIARTDFVAAWGWLGLRVPLWTYPAYLRRFQQEDAMARAGQNSRLAEKGCDAVTYEKAIKILVLHHSPLERDLYREISPAEYQWTQLMGRARVQQFAREIGIHIVAFGHTHENLTLLDTGTLYVDAGTASAYTLEDFEKEYATHKRARPCTVNIYEFWDDDRLVVKPFVMEGDTYRFMPRSETTFRLGRDGVAMIPSVTKA